MTTSAAGCGRLPLILLSAAALALAPGSAAARVLLQTRETPPPRSPDLFYSGIGDTANAATTAVAGTLAQCRPDAPAGKCSRCLGVLRAAVLGGTACRAGGARSGVCLLRYDVWSQWNDGKVEEKLDRDHLGIVSEEQMQQALRCVHVALLCVQKAKSRRPAMEEVVNFLSNEMHLGGRSFCAWLPLAGRSWRDWIFR
ncbi:hypothetical protein EJB05_38310, partial [Eragrostis curvula]